MITCKVIGYPDGLDESVHFHRPSGNPNWHFEFLDRNINNMKRPIQRFRCKDRRNNINFYYLEFETPTPTNKKVFAFRNNSDRTLFILTYFGG